MGVAAAVARGARTGRHSPGSRPARSAYLAMHVLLKRTWPAGLGCHHSAVCPASRACKRPAPHPGTRGHASSRLLPTRSAAKVTGPLPAEPANAVVTTRETAVVTTAALPPGSPGHTRRSGKGPSRTHPCRRPASSRPPAGAHTPPMADAEPFAGGSRSRVPAAPAAALTLLRLPC